MVYDKGGMQPAEYRRFNVKDVTAGDDYGAMRYALDARYRNEATLAQVISDAGLGERGAAPV